jgi:hypothetical protein
LARCNNRLPKKQIQVNNRKKKREHIKATDKTLIITTYKYSVVQALKYIKHAGQTRVSIRQIQNKKGRLGPIATSDVLDIEAV